MHNLIEFLHEHQLTSYLINFIGIYLILSLAALRYDVINGIVQLAKRLSSSKILLILFFLSSFLFMASFASSVLLRFPDTGSEYNYTYQAETFLKGRLWNKPPPQDFFTPDSPMVNKNGKWLTRSFPGWPFLLSIAKILRIPAWLLNPALGTISLIILFLLGKLLYNNTIGLLSAAAALCSPFFLFNTSSFEPHTSCGLLIILAVYFYYSLYFEKNRLYPYVLTGICLGAAFLIRPFSTLCCLVPLLIALIVKRKNDLFPKNIWFFLLGLSPFFLINFLYNYLITGSFFVSPFNWTIPGDTVQFKKSIILDNLYSVKNQFLWMNPAIFIMYFCTVIPLAFKRKILAFELIFLILVVACFFYVVPKASYGSRYYFEGYLLCILTVLGHLAQLKNGAVKRMITLALIAGFFTSLLITPVFALHYRHKIYKESEVYRLVEEKHLSNAIVLMPPEMTQSMTDARNDPDLQNTVLYAHDLKERNALLLKYFPTRNFYLYAPEEKNEWKRLQKYKLAG